MTIGKYTISIDNGVVEVSEGSDVIGSLPLETLEHIFVLALKLAKIIK